MSFKNPKRQLQIMHLRETLCAGENAMRRQDIRQALQTK